MTTLASASERQGEMPLGHAFPSPRSNSGEHSGREAMNAPQQFMRTLLRLTQQLASCHNTTQAAVLAADELRRFLNAQQVAIGFSDRLIGLCRLTAVSGVTRLDSKSEMAKVYESVLDEAASRGETRLQSSATGISPVCRPITRQLNSKTVITGVLRRQDGSLQGTWIVFLEDELQPESATLSQVDEFFSHLAPEFELIRRATSGVLARTIDAVRSLISGWTGRASMLAILAVCLGMLLPWPYTISCECDLQPVMRRYVAAPFDTTLEKTLVAPGDVVKQGDLLATLDGREIRWELAGLEAEQRQAEKQRDAAMASRKVAESQIARLEMERAQLKKQILEKRAENLEIRSPVSGIVVGGDLEKVEGAPLEIGQTMFEIAPLQQMIIEIAIPEREIAHVHPGMSTTVRLDAFPSRRAAASILAIHPRTETRDGKTVFIAEALLENTSELLRPGMKGCAVIRGNMHLLGWNLFHRAWESTALRFGW